MEKNFEDFSIFAFEMKSVNNKFSSLLVFYVQYFIRKLSIQLVKYYPRSERE